MKTFPQQSCLFRALALLVWLAVAGTAQQQPAVSSVRVFTEPSGAIFSVDGVYYSGPATFLWPANTKHQLKIVPLQDSHSPRLRYNFTEWTDSSGQMTAGPATVVTADPSISYFKASLRIQYPVSLIFFKCPNAPVEPCDTPGVVRINGVPYAYDTTNYVDPGATLQLQAEPNPGYVFVGWLQGLGNLNQSFINSVTVNQATDIYPRFERAALIHLKSSPPGLKLLADRTPVRSPSVMEWGMNTVHTVGAETPQVDDHGQVWVFDSWSDGGTQTHAYTMGKDLTTYSLEIRYVRGARVSFVTSPPGLKLKVDARENWQGYNFTWAPGSSHTVSAAEKQVDARGQTWNFRQWSNGGPLSQDVVVPDSAVNDGLRLTAVYDPVGRVTVRSDPAGVTIAVDGEGCATPCTVERTPGSMLRLSAPETSPAGDGARLDFASWSDGAQASRELEMPSAPLSLTARYGLRYHLAVGSEPSEAGRLTLDPVSPDGYFDAGQTVMAALETRPGFKFKGWQGDASGLARTVAFSMTSPRQARAAFERVPYIPPDGVQNAAGPTPVNAVASGSIVAVTGVHLASDYQAGPESPPAQTLGGVFLRLGESVLPLFYVSPERLQALLPDDVAPGEYKLEVGRENQPATTVDFRVERNAPGLFRVETETGSFALAFHEDGSNVTPEKPARRGERVSILGTGFGPYTRQPLAGFAVPPAPEYPLADLVEVVAGEIVATPEFSGAAPGKVGVTVVRFTVPAEFPSGSIDLRVRVNGTESNTVPFPVE